MNWANLRDLECPKCGDELKHEEHKQFFSCGCGFSISEEKFKEITLKQDEGSFKKSGFKHLSDDELRQSELNNMEL